MAAAVSDPGIRQMAPLEAADMFTGIWLAPYASLLRAAGDGSEAGDEPDSYKGASDYNIWSATTPSDLETMGGRSREEVRRHLVVRSSRSEPGQTNAGPTSRRSSTKNFGTADAAEPNEVTLIYEQDHEFRKIRMNQSISER